MWQAFYQRLATNRMTISVSCLEVGKDLYHTTHVIIMGRVYSFIQEMAINKSMLIIIFFIVSLLCSWLIVWALNKNKITNRILLEKI